MGKSRSATVVIAYMMQKHHISPQEALERLQQSRPLVEPNDGFMEQLALYHEMMGARNLEDDPRYQRWLYQRDVHLSNACGKAPDNIRFEDEQRAGGSGREQEEVNFELRCRKCRYVFVLIISNFKSAFSHGLLTITTGEH
jgi:dual specificity phosphatase 12